LEGLAVNEKSFGKCLLTLPLGNPLRWIYKQEGGSEKWKRK
jgi:hypothetical protein